MQFLLKRFPNLSGFECDPSLRYARTNPGPQGLLPGGYTNEFISGPMLSPSVWGSLASAGKGGLKDDVLSARWYSASALDYYLRRRFTHGVTFGNVNGMSSQFLLGRAARLHRSLSAQSSSRSSGTGICFWMMSITLW